jgi:hypothetical protein
VLYVCVGGGVCLSMATNMLARQMISFNHGTSELLQDQGHNVDPVVKIGL